jgi:hypothetical protein
MIESDAVAGRTLAVLDLRGDLIDRVLVRLCAGGKVPPERVVLMDLRREDRTVGLNPLSGSCDRHARAYRVLDVVKHRSDGWGVQIDETLRNCLIVLAEAGQSLVEVEPLLTDAGFRGRTLQLVSDASALAFFDRYDRMSPERRAAWAAPVLNKVTPFTAVPRVRRTLGSAVCLDVRRLMDEPGAVLLVALAVDRLHSAAQLLGGLAVTAIEDAAMSRADVPEPRRNGTGLYVDEFETMASESFQSVVAEGRRFGLSLVLSHQNSTQVPLEMRHVVRNNVGIQVFFQTGALDAAELAKELLALGKREEVQRQLVSQDVGEALLLRRGKRPVRVRTLYEPDPVVPESETAAYVERALSHCSRPAHEVDAEIAARTAGRRAGTEAGVRHVRRPLAGRRGAE